ncbi:TlpA disulfide reductase family protein [Paenibacillus filicis]|uniref:TlpA disulfide reductase family protein n=1 Tax=Paenibacillus gyeongsangnamensis TaxID=3388067 RepID=A0ABT4Q749_9BACL|nr:TlpA disulfide reductase family protein [Paenibacillus filicis]MCZ8512696.1 TlpA disulfide reductase family protein [Paenibacillus filicis]
MKKQVFLIILILCATILTLWNHKGKPQEVWAKIGQPAPPFRLSLLNGQAYTLKPGEGKPMIINFWASWCEPCKEEMPALSAIYETYRDQIELVAVTGKDEASAVNAFVREYKIPFPVLLDPGTEAAEAYRIVQIPTTYLVNKEGIITERILGPTDSAALQNKIKLLLQQER